MPSVSPSNVGTRGSMRSKSTKKKYPRPQPMNHVKLPIHETSTMPRSANIFGKTARTIVGMPAHSSVLTAFGLYPFEYQ